MRGWPRKGLKFLRGRRDVIFSPLGIYAAVVACTVGEIAAWGGLVEGWGGWLPASLGHARRVGRRL